MFWPSVHLSVKLMSLANNNRRSSKLVTTMKRNIHANNNQGFNSRHFSKKADNNNAHH